ncbi:MAG: flagellar protein FlaG [Methylobacter sp.]
MESLNSLAGLASVNPALKPELPEANRKTATPPDIKVSPNSVAEISPQVVPNTSKTAMDKSAARGGEYHTKEQIAGAVADMNEFFQLAKRSLQFSLDEDSEMMVIQIRDEDGQVIKQIPQEEALELARRLDEFRGLLFESKA